MPTKEKLFTALMAIITVLLIYGNLNIYFFKSEDREYKESLRAFRNVLKYVQDEYVDPAKANSEDLLNGAIKGLTEALRDDFSYFLPVKALKELKEDIGGEFGGLGMYIDSRDGYVLVVSPIPGTPA